MAHNQEEEAASPPSSWQLVREAIAGTERTLTEIPLGQAVLLLAVPTVLEMGMESLFAIVDIFFVSRLGPSAVATVGLTESMLSPTYALAMGLAAAATAVIARRTGEKDHEGAANAAAHVIGLALVLALALGVVGAVFAPSLLRLMGADAEVIATGSGYTSVLLGGSVTIFLLFVINASFRGAGDAAIAMRTLWLANGLNIVLGPCFIFGLGPFPKLGVLGAAVATTLSRAIGVGYQLVRLLRGKRLRIARRHLVLRPSLVGELVRIASGGSIQVLVETASWLGLVRILSAYGSATLAAYTIAMRIVIFALLPAWGLANAAATLVGQNLGAEEPGRAESSVRAVARINLVFLGAVGAVFVAFPQALVALFTSDPAIASQGADCLRLVALGFVTFAYGMVAVQAFNGAGDTTTPLILNIVSFWAFKLPCAWVLSHVLGMGPRGTFIAIATAYAFQSIVAWLLFRRGSWKKRKV